jgi:competence protein ComEA
MGLGSEDSDVVSRRRLAHLTGGGPVRGWIPTQPRAAVAAEAPADWRQRWLVAAHGPALAWLLGAGVIVVLVAAYALSRHHGTPPAPVDPPSAVTPAAVPSSPSLVVDVGGRVRHPGLVTLPAGSRVADAIAAAGGALRPADLATVNLAARVTDGELLLVGVPGAAVGAGAGSGTSGDGESAPMDLNSATVEQLDTLPGVGPVLAQRIVGWRQQHGGFRRVDDLQQVPGIGARKFADLKPLVTV